MSNIDWDFITETIQNEKCILLIGPEIAATADETPFHAAMLDYLDVQHNENILAYYPNDEFFLFKDAIAKTRTYYKIKKFYNQEFSRKIYEQIALIPFHLIISVSPDLFLSRIFQHYNLAHEFDFYGKNEVSRPLKPPSLSNPLIYNLFGNINNEESLILTHDDMFNFLLSILGKRNLPDELKNAMEAADNFIFVGFKFEKWYVQLILRLLNMHRKDEKYSFERFAYNLATNSDTQAFCFNQFKIKFVNGESSDFISELYERCKKEGMLRSTGQAKKKTSEILPELIEKDQIERAIQLMKDFFKDKSEELTDDVTLLASRYNRMVSKLNKGTIDSREADVELNKIKEAMLAIGDEIKALE